MCSVICVLTLQVLLQSCWNTFSVSCLSTTLCEHMWLIPDVQHDWSKLWSVTHARVVSVGERLFPLTLLTFFSVADNPSRAPFICHVSTAISLWCVPPPPPPPSSLCLSLSVSGVQFCRPGGADFPRGNERGLPEGGSAHRVRAPAAGGCLCHRNPVHSPSHPLHWARQPGWEVASFTT